MDYSFGIIAEGPSYYGRQPRMKCALTCLEASKQASTGLMTDGCPSKFLLNAGATAQRFRSGASRRTQLEHAVSSLNRGENKCTTL